MAYFGGIFCDRVGQLQNRKSHTSRTPEKIGKKWAKNWRKIGKILVLSFFFCHFSPIFWIWDFLFCSWPTRSQGICFLQIWGWGVVRIVFSVAFSGAPWRLQISCRKSSDRLLASYSIECTPRGSCNSTLRRSLVAPYRAILPYHRCDTPYRAILLREVSTPPQMVRSPSLGT